MGCGALGEGLQLLQAFPHLPRQRVRAQPPSLSHLQGVPLSLSLLNGGAQHDLHILHLVHRVVHGRGSEGSEQCRQAGALAAGRLLRAGCLEAAAELLSREHSPDKPEGGSEKGAGAAVSEAVAAACVASRGSEPLQTKGLVISSSLRLQTKLWSSHNERPLKPPFPPLLFLSLSVSFTFHQSP